LRIGINENKAENPDPGHPCLVGWYVNIRYGEMSRMKKENGMTEQREYNPTT
jgi:hypothetical protein